MYVLPTSIPCFISRWQRCGKLVKGISLLATKQAMSNNLSIFWATSWETVQSTRGSGTKRRFSATLMAATARLWPFYLWLRIDSILKFVEPVTNTDEESLSVVLLQQGLHCIFSPSYSNQGKSFVQLRTKFLFPLLPLDCEASPSSLPFLFELEEFVEWEFEPEGTKKALISIEYHPSANDMADTFICHWRAWWEDLDPVSLAECGLAVKLFTFIRVKDYWLFAFFFLHVNIVSQFSQH